MEFSTLPGILQYMKEKYSDQHALNLVREDGWLSWSVGEFYHAVKCLALGMDAEGIRGQHVGIIAPSSPYWMMVDLAAMAAGNVTVPIFKRISAESMAFETKDAKVKYIFIGHQGELDMVRRHGHKIKKIIPLQMEAEGKDILPFDDLLHKGSIRAEQEPDRFEQLLGEVKEDDLATIIYTSGSTGHPKGVELTQRNIVSQVHASMARFPRNPEEDVGLSSLPLAHIFERMIGYYYLASGVSVYFIDSLDRLGDYIREVRPTVMTVVPRLLEKVYDRFRERMEAKKGPGGVLARKAFERATVKPVNASGRGPVDTLYRKTVYPKLKEALGGRLGLIISGASPLPTRIGRFFLNVGFPLFEGYGLTEASPVIAVNYPGHNKLGTVGPVFPGVEVQIADDGEVLARGPNVMRGYHNDKKATRETLDKEGFLHTGDLGSLDAEGYLTITGRKKELFKKSTGEYVAPVPIEQRLAASPYVDTAMVVADQRKFPGALIFPDMEKVKELQHERGRSQESHEEFLESDEFRDEIRRVIEATNAYLHHTEEIQAFAVVPDTLSVEEGDLTPTLKLRRHAVEEKYKSIIDGLYEQS